MLDFQIGNVLGVLDCNPVSKRETSRHPFLILALPTFSP